MHCRCQYTEKLLAVSRLCITCRSYLSQTRNPEEYAIKDLQSNGHYVLLCWCGDWALNRVDKSRIEKTDMKLFRQVAGYILQHEISSLAIPNVLRIFCIGRISQTEIRNCNEHFAQIYPCRSARQALTLSLRVGGRPRKRWEDDL